MTDHINKVVIVGAGLCGTLLAFILARHGIECDILEDTSVVSQHHKGIIYGPTCTQVLKKIGLEEELREDSNLFKGVSWRTLKGDTVIDLHRFEDKTTSLSDFFPTYSVQKMVRQLMAHLADEPFAQVHLNHKVTSVGQEGGSAWVEVKHGNTNKRYTGDLVLGCDGAESEIRKRLFGTEFPGTTWDKQLVIVDIQSKFDKDIRQDYQFIMDPEHWGVVYRLSEADQTWRIMYGVDTSLSLDEIKQDCPAKLRVMLSGGSATGNYGIHDLRTYPMHQRCVERMASNRIMLAGDAAHLTVPIGNPSVLGALTDACSLAECIIAINNKVARLDIFDQWSKARIEVFHEHINKRAMTNLERLVQDPDKLDEQDPLVKTLKEAEHSTKARSYLRIQELDVLTDIQQFCSDTTAWDGALSTPDCIVS